MIPVPVRRGGVVVALTAVVPSLALAAVVPSLALTAVVPSLVLTAVVPSLALADETRPGLATAPWKLEGLTLGDGRRLQGLVIDPSDTGDDGAAVRFVQIIQRPGRAMELITWPPINAERIVAIDRLPPADHGLLAKRVEAFRNRRGSQHAAETAVTLVRDDENGPWRYAGRWFTLESTADPTLTRQAVVRLEQVLTALEALVPPPIPTDGPPHLSVRLCGTTAEYRDVQTELGIEAMHPAFYVPDHELLVAGSDMPAIIEQERTAADNLALAEREVAARDRAFDADVRRLAGDLERQGMAAGRRAEIVQLARHRWHRERDGLLAQLAAARRENAVRLGEARREFSGRLTHEAWHAYADRQLSANGRSALPLWLDEGLAQVFETAPLEAGELRLDAPDPPRLKALQELLASGAAPPLEELLRAGQSQFLVGHAGGRTASRQSYLVAWGLAFHLAVLEPVLAPRSLVTLSRPSAGAGEAAGRVAEFERLVGMPVAAFDATWRRRMLDLKPVLVSSGP